MGSAVPVLAALEPTSGLLGSSSKPTRQSPFIVQSDGTFKRGVVSSRCDLEDRIALATAHYQRLDSRHSTAPLLLLSHHITPTAQASPPSQLVLHSSVSFVLYPIVGSKLQRLSSLSSAHVTGRRLTPSLPLEHTFLSSCSVSLSRGLSVSSLAGLDRCRAAL